MGENTRYRLGKLWKQGKAKGDFEQYYLEFKDKIDAELNPISKDEIPSDLNKKVRK